MPSNPPTVADLEAAVAGRCALALAEAGAYLRAVDGSNNKVTPAIREGLRRGVKCVGLFVADPLTLADADLAGLSPFAAERVVDEAELFALERALLQWHLAVRKYEEKALTPAPMAGGWLMEEKRNAQARVSQLRAALATPYREPADPVAVAPAAPGFPCPCPGPTVRFGPPGCYPPEIPDPFGPFWWW